MWTTSHALPICSASRPTAWPHPSPYTRVDRTSLARRKLGEASGAAGWAGWAGFRQGRHARHNVGPHRNHEWIQTGSAEGKGRGRSSTQGCCSALCLFTGELECTGVQSACLLGVLRTYLLRYRMGEKEAGSELFVFRSFRSHRQPQLSPPARRRRDGNQLIFRAVWREKVWGVRQAHETPT